MMTANDKQRVSGSDDFERCLLEQVATGSREAIAELYRLYQPRLFKFIYRVTRSYSATEELVNDVMVTVWRQATSFRGESRLSTWILSIAYRQALRHVTRKTLSIAPDVNPDDMAGGPSTIETEQWIHRGLDGLPAAQRMTVIMVFYLGMSYDEIAAVSDCPVNTVKTRMFHARKKLQSRLTAIATPDNDGGDS